MEIYCFLLSFPKDLFTPYHSSIFRIEITKRDTSFLILVLNFTGADSGFSGGGGGGGGIVHYLIVIVV